MRKRDKELTATMACSSCGHAGADARPNWSERPERPTLLSPTFEKKKPAPADEAEAG